MNKIQRQVGTFLVMSICLGQPAITQDQVNYDENAIEPYVLPELLILKNGEIVEHIDDWVKKRRIEILTIFKNQVYGNIPEGNFNPSSMQVIEQCDSALDNLAIRKQIAIVFKKKDRELTINLLLYLPKDTKSPPVFLGYNFYGNHTICTDRNIILTNAWIRNNSGIGITNNRTTEESRGKKSSRWPLHKIIGEGFGVATMYYGDVDPDKNDFTDGIHPFFYTEGQNKPDDDEWGSISAWAWGISRVLDYLVNDELLLNSRFIVFGHSRLGKTALWAGALDNRLDIVISNNSGCGGAAIFRRKYGETITSINDNFPHWFNENFKKYNNRENELPIDQHMLIALIAPRPVYIASAQEDRWADPKGEYLSAYHAGTIYELYGEKTLTDSIPPAPNEPIHNRIGYHIRTGKHDITAYDWEQFIHFARKHLNQTEPSDKR